MNSDVELIQGSEEWLAARCGSLGASEVADAIAHTKTGWGASRANVMGRLIAERLTGVPADSYVSPEMRRGKEVEPEARLAYEFRQDVEVVQAGIFRHPYLMGTHASPDGLIGNDGLVEIKVPNTATHIETLLGAPIPGRYHTQMQWQMACTGRKWCDWVSYDNRLPERMRLHIIRVDRNDKVIAEFAKQVREFLAELDTKVAALTKLYGQKEAA